MSNSCKNPGIKARLPLLGAAAIASVIALGAVSARANVINYQVANVNGGDGTGTSGLDANFAFDVSAGQVSVTINNTTKNTASDGEEIYGLSFDLVDASGHGVSLPAAPSYTLTNGKEVTLASTGKGSSADFKSTVKSVDQTTMSKPWLTSGSGDLVSLQIDSSKPNDLVIAPPPSLNDYGSASGLNSVLQHNPSLLSGATFNLAIADAAVGDQIENVTILYGTGPSSISATPIGGSSVPEPATLGILGFGAMGLLLRKRRKIA